jgi:hypothetical protein
VVVVVFVCLRAWAWACVCIGMRVHMHDHVFVHNRGSECVPIDLRLSLLRKRHGGSVAWYTCIALIELPASRTCYRAVDGSV